ncbi:MAG: BlaI/MecI/CopY family transcriptional regulator [Planctomycetales bacterium]
MKGSTPLGPLELQIMDRLWDSDERLSVRQVLDLLPGRRRLAYTTVMTVLDRLHTKGLVSRSRAGRAYFYRSRVTRDAYVAKEVDQVLARTTDRQAALLGFVRGVGEDDLVSLRTLIRDVERERRHPRKG